MKVWTVPNHPNQFAPILDSEKTPSQSVRAWIDLMTTMDQLVMAGMVRQFGAEKAKARYREWFSKRTAEHGQQVATLAKRLSELPEAD